MALLAIMSCHLLVRIDYVQRCHYRQRDTTGNNLLWWSDRCSTFHYILNLHQSSLLVAGSNWVHEIICFVGFNTV